MNTLKKIMIVIEIVNKLIAMDNEIKFSFKESDVSSKTLMKNMLGM